MSTTGEAQTEAGQTFEEITKRKPEKALTLPLKKKAGRNAQGRVTVRHRGAGEKTRYRRIDFKREKFGIPARVSEIEYDPNRTANIARTFSSGVPWMSAFEQPWK